MTAPWTPGDPVPHIHDHVPEMLAEAGVAAEGIRALLDFDVASVLWQRQVAKGEMFAALARHAGLDLELAQFQALIAIIRIRFGVGRAATEPTIGLVAEDLGLDPSRASRIVADLVARGMVRRQAVQADGRKSHLWVTDEGYQMLDAVRREKWKTMVQVFRGWEPDMIAHFARGIRAYTEGVQRAIAELTSAPSGGE